MQAFYDYFQPNDNEQRFHQEFNQQFTEYLETEDSTLYPPTSMFIRIVLFNAIVNLDFDYANWISRKTGAALIEADDGGDITILRYAVESGDGIQTEIVRFIAQSPTTEWDNPDHIEEFEDAQLGHLVDKYRRIRKKIAKRIPDNYPRLDPLVGNVIASYLP